MSKYQPRHLRGRRGSTDQEGGSRKRNPRTTGAPAAEPQRPVDEGLTTAEATTAMQMSDGPQGEDGPVVVQKTSAEPADDATKDAATQQNVGRSAALMSVLVIVSRITGFFRTWGQAFALGVTVMSSCYTVANNLPNQLYELVMGGLLVTAFLPVYLGVKQRLGRKGANDYVSNLLSIVMLLMGVLTVMGFIFAGPVVWTQSFSANSDFDFNLAVYFFRFFVIEIMFYALSSILSGILNAERDYFWSNAAPIFNNVICTASFFIYVLVADTNPALGVLALAIGNPLGVLVQVVLQVPSLKKHGIKLRFHIDLHDHALMETLAIGAPTLITTVVSFVTTSVQTSSALSVTPAGSSIAYYSRLWYTLPYAILAIPITTAMFTELSDMMSKKDNEGFVNGVSRGTSQIFFFLNPCALYLIVFATPLITLMAVGKFSSDEIALTADYLRALAISLPIYGVCTYLQKACSALRHMYVYAAANVVGGALQVLACLFLTPVFGLMVVPLSSVLVFLTVDVVAFAHIRHKFGHLGLRAVVVSCVRSLALGAAGSVVGYGIYRALCAFGGAPSGSAMHALVYVVAAGIPALVVTFGLAVLLKVPESSMVRVMLARLKPGSRRAA